MHGEGCSNGRGPHDRQAYPAGDGARNLTGRLGITNLRPKSEGSHFLQYQTINAVRIAAIVFSYGLPFGLFARVTKVNFLRMDFMLAVLASYPKQGKDDVSVIADVPKISL